MIKPEFINGKYYVEVPTYGVIFPHGAILDAAKKHFAGRNNISALEIGVAGGANAYNIYEELNPSILILVDPWGGTPEPHATNYVDTWFRMQGKENTFIVKAKSEEAAKILNLTFDFIYIDGDHIGGDLSKGTEEEGIRKDIKLWLPRMNDGGLIGGHDYNYKNIFQEVNLVFGKERVNFYPNDMQAGGVEWWVFV